MESRNELVKFNRALVNDVSEEIDFQDIPLTALRQKSRLLLSRLLNPTKILPSEEGYPRDWRGIAHLAGIHHVPASVIASQPDPMAKILHLWYTEGQRENATFKYLQKFLELIDRWDVVDDVKESLEEDAKFYITNRNKQVKHDNSLSTQNCIEPDQNILTKDDVLRAQEGLPPQLYDAFVLFADEDIDFATELIERMENFGSKLCVKERDLIGGVSFEHEAILRLISERCNRLIVIVSPSFLKSAANTFFVNFAQALGIEQGRRKIVPCLYERCVLPPTLNFYFLLNYQRSGKLWNFWDKLKDSLKSTPIEHNIKTQIPSITISNVEDNGKSSTKAHSSPLVSIIENSTIAENYQKEISKMESVEICEIPTPIQRVPSQSKEHNNSTITSEKANHNSLSVNVSRSSVTLNGATNSTSQTAKKSKWYKKILHSNKVHSEDIVKQKSKKKWFGKKLLAI